MKRVGWVEVVILVVTVKNKVDQLFWKLIRRKTKEGLVKGSGKFALISARTKPLKRAFLYGRMIANWN